MLMKMQDWYVLQRGFNQKQHLLNKKIIIVHEIEHGQDLTLGSKGLNGAIQLDILSST